LTLDILTVEPIHDRHRGLCPLPLPAALDVLRCRCRRCAAPSSGCAVAARHRPAPSSQRASTLPTDQKNIALQTSRWENPLQIPSRRPEVRISPSPSPFPTRPQRLRCRRRRRDSRNASRVAVARPLSDLAVLNRRLWHRLRLVKASSRASRCATKQRGDLSETMGVAGVGAVVLVLRCATRKPPSSRACTTSHTSHHITSRRARPGPRSSSRSLHPSYATCADPTVRLRTRSSLVSRRSPSQLR
jgi:hypothetical protein